MNLFMTALLTASLGMSGVILALLLLNRLLGDRLPASHRYYMWLAVLLGLLIPFRPGIPLPFEPIRIPVPFAAMEEFGAADGGARAEQMERTDALLGGNSLPASESAGDFTGAIGQSLTTSQANQVNQADQADQESLAGPAAGRRVPSPVSPALLLFGAWAIGAAGVLAFHLRSYARFAAAVRRWGQDAEDVRVLSAMRAALTELGLPEGRIAVKVCPLVPSPMLIGFLRPAILLPEKVISPDELECVFRHELIHYRRGDLWVNALVLLVSAMHWFNPLVPLMARRVRADCEASCDERVVAGGDTDERRQYGETIIGFAGAGNTGGPVLSTYFYGGGNNMKRRLVSIMDTSRKNRVLAAVCAVAVLITTVLSGSVLAAPGGAGQYVGEARAKAIAIKHAGITEAQVDFIRAYLVRDDGRVVYDVEFYSGDREFDYEIDAVSGNIIEFERDVERSSVRDAQTPPAQAAGQYIGEARARALALKDAGLSESQVRRMRVKLDREHGAMVYEVEFRRGFMEYEYEIDAVSGAILKSSADYDD